jgi:hypothetical protein
LLTACPVRGGLLLVMAFALATIMLVWRELRGLMGTRRALAAAVGTATLAVPEAPSRSGSRLLVLLGAILATQAGIYALAQHLWPMIGMMRMSGVLMRMPIDGALPLVPVQLAVATVLALIVWRLERRVARMRAVIAALQELLRSIPARRTRPRQTGTSIGSCWMQAGLLGFSRPPPLAH